MRERMDFSSISKIVLDNRNIDSITNSEYYFKLFAYAFLQSELDIPIPDDRDISKILIGQRNVTKDIIYLYQQQENAEYLKEGISEILKQTSDSSYVKEMIYRLLWDDNSISQIKKKELSCRYDDTDSFLSDCLMFALSRNFITKEKKQDSYARKKDFVLSDYLVDYHFPTTNKVFLGREKELVEIHNEISKNNHLFLEGIGGIGKSELAKQYVKRYKKEYENIIYLRYMSSLRKTIVNLDFIDDAIGMTEEELFRNHYRFIKSLNRDVLVVLDNFDTIPENDDLFHEFLSLPFRLLVTTRSHIEGISAYPIKEINNMDDLLKLFYAYAPKGKEKEWIVRNIIEEVYHHTLTVEMAAKTMETSVLSPERLLSALREEGVSLSNPNKVSVTKDSRTKKERLYNHILTLFRLQELSELNQYMLRNMALMPETGILKPVFHKWLETEDYNIVNELVDYGWVQQDGERERVSLHPFVHEVIVKYTKPSISNCDTLLRNVYVDCVSYILDKFHYRDLLNVIESIFSNVIIDDNVSACLLMDGAMCYLEKYGRMDIIEKVLDIMADVILTKSDSEWVKAIYYCHRGGVASAKNDFISAKNHFEEGIRILDISNKTYAALACNLYNNLGSVYFSLLNVELSWKNFERARQIREAYSLPYGQNGIRQDLNRSLVLSLMGREKEAESILLNLLKTWEKMPYIDTALAEIYTSLGVIKMKESLTESKAYLLKGKECYLSHLSPENEKVKQTDLLVQIVEHQIKMGIQKMQQKTIYFE